MLILLKFIKKVSKFIEKKVDLWYSKNQYELLLKMGQINRMITEECLIKEIYLDNKK